MPDATEKAIEQGSIEALARELFNQEHARDPLGCPYEATMCYDNLWDKCRKPYRANAQKFLRSTSALSADSP